MRNISQIVVLVLFTSLMSLPLTAVANDTLEIGFLKYSDGFDGALYGVTLDANKDGATTFELSTPSGTFDGSNVGDVFRPEQLFFDLLTDITFTKLTTEIASDWTLIWDKGLVTETVAIIRFRTFGTLMESDFLAIPTLTTPLNGAIDISPITSFDWTYDVPTAEAQKDIVEMLLFGPTDQSLISGEFSDLLDLALSIPGDLIQSSDELPLDVTSWTPATGLLSGTWIAVLINSDSILETADGLGGPITGEPWILENSDWLNLTSADIAGFKVIFDCSGLPTNVLREANCGFDSGIAGWSALGGVNATPNLVEGNPTSGSFQIDSVIDDDGDHAIMIRSPCVLIAPSSTYQVEGQFKLIDPLVTATCGYGAIGYSDDNCAESPSEYGVEGEAEIYVSGSEWTSGLWVFPSRPVDSSLQFYAWCYTDPATEPAFTVLMDNFIVDDQGAVVSERDALVTLYNITDGPNWTDNSNWLVGDPCLNSWFGVSCDNLNATITGIYLYGNNLTGTLPAELGNLVNLNQLLLDRNQLSGAIPAELGNLANLQQMYLYENQLSGTIPAELGNLANLVVLYLYENQLSGTIPGELGNLANLAFLSLKQNQLSGAIPVELGNLANLTYLSLYNNQLSGPIPAELGNLANLVVLSLSVNQLSGTIPPELRNLTNLENLVLRANQLSGTIPAELGNLANLQQMYLYENQLSGTIPAELGNLANLLWLRLDQNQLNGTIPAELGDLTNLQILSLASNKLSGAIPGSFSNLTSLSLADGGLDLQWNGLYTSDGALDEFLDTRSESDWSATQTIAPDNVDVENQGDGSATMFWDPIEYSADTGRYRVFYSDTPGGPYIDAGVTSDKTENSLTVHGLSPDLAYHFEVQTETDAHANNTNDVISEISTEVSSAPEYIYESTDFASDFNFLTEPLDSTIFTELDRNNGFDPTQDAIVSVVDANMVTPGQLTITSQDATWQDEADDGVFLGVKVYGGFIAEMTVTSMDALAGHSVGLMVRVPAENNLDAAGPGQDYVTLGVSGGVTQIEWSSTDENKTNKLGASEGSAAALNRINGALENGVHFRIQRNGSALRAYYRIGLESTWTELEGSPLDRPDINTLELEVGIYQTSEAQATAVVDDFSVRSERIFHSSFE